jgi:multidrug resistance efflux pump
MNYRRCEVEAPAPVVAVPWPQRLEAFKRQALPVLVWFGLAAVVAVLMTDRARYAHYTGMAHSAECLVSPTAVGRVETVVVAINDRVSRGDAVVLLDDASLDAGVRTAEATVRRLRADLAAAAASLAADSGRVATDLLRLQMDEDSRRLDALSLRASLSGDGVELERRALEAQRTDLLAARGLATQADRDNSSLLHDELRTRSEQTKQLLAQTEREWQAARERRETYERRLPAGGGEQVLLEPLREAIAVEEARMQEVELQRAALVLRSPVTGQVSQVLCSEGQAVRPGDPVLTIVESSIRDIVIYVDEADGRRFAARSPVVVTRRAPARGSAESVIVSVGESVQPLPPRLWRDPRVASYGRTIVVAPVDALGLSPGELVDVKVLPSR